MTDDVSMWQVNTVNLERVRRVKTRHQRLQTRIVTVREELQRFLEDDDDMMKMCLTRKKELERMLSAHGNTGAPITWIIRGLERTGVLHIWLLWHMPNAECSHAANLTMQLSSLSPKPDTRCMCFHPF